MRIISWSNIFVTSVRLRLKSFSKRSRVSERFDQQFLVTLFSCRPLWRFSRNTRTINRTLKNQISAIYSYNAIAALRDRRATDHDDQQRLMRLDLFLRRRLCSSNSANLMEFFSRSLRSAMSIKKCREQQTSRHQNLQRIDFRWSLRRWTGDKREQCSDPRKGWSADEEIKIKIAFTENIDEDERSLFLKFFNGVFRID